MLLSSYSVATSHAPPGIGLLCVRVLQIRAFSMAKSDNNHGPVGTIAKLNPLTPTVAIWVLHPVTDRVKPSFVIFDIRAL